MSVCLEPNAVLSSSANSAPELELLETAPSSSAITINKEAHDSSFVPTKNVTKLVLANTLATAASGSTPVLQKVPSSSVITVVNASGPITILKNLCSNSCGTSTPQFTLVNSSPLSVCNAIGKPITVVGTPPITVVRTLSNVNPPITFSTDEVTKSTDTITNSVPTITTANGSLPPSFDKPAIHNVFVKNTTVPPDLVPTSNDVPQQPQIQKVVPANSFLQNNVIQTVTTTTNVTKAINGQKPITTNNKLKIIGNVVVPPATTAGPSSTNITTNNSNIILNKSVTPKHLQNKMINSSLNGTPKFMNRNPVVTANNFIKAGTSGKTVPASKTQKVLYPTHKSQIRTMPPVNNTVSKSGIKTLSPQPRGGISNQQVQRTSSGLRTIPPQRPSKLPNKPNYIGKHAIQAQKFKSPQGIGKVKTSTTKPLPVPTVNNLFPHRTPQNTGVSYHQALTANILQSLSENSNNSSGSYNSSRGFDFSSRFDGNHSFNERTTSYNEAYIPPPPPKPQSNLETLSFVCQAVLLDHNYNATPPAEPTSRTAPCTTPVQLNGTSIGSYYSPTGGARNRSSLSSSNTLTTLSSISNTSVLPNNNSSSLLQDDDAASDISCGSERKLETEGEETDTAPEAEAVTNEDGYDHYGDYVTRCICDFIHDDGYMIECDKCKVWQHVRCVIKNNKKVPDDYLCEVCDPTKPVDRSKARTLQQQWMRENQEREAKLRKEAKLRELKLKETLSDSDSSDAEQTGVNMLNKNRVGANGRRKSEQGQRQNPRQRRDSARPENSIRRNIKRKERKVTKKKVKPVAKSDEETQDIWSQSTISQMPQLRQWIEHYEEAVTNHYSPELRARISSIRINGIHSDLSAQMDTSVHKCRIYTQPLTGLKYLVSTMHMTPNTPVVELRGKYMLSTQHRSNATGHGGTLTTRQHAQRPGPFLFFYRLHKDNTEVCVDTRTYGNAARFVRRSCKPNAELRHCIEKGVLHLYIVTISTMEKNMELTIKHESHDLAAVGTTHIACACSKPDECTVNKNPVKKNGETIDVCSNAGFRKRRGRRTVSTASEQQEQPPAIVQKPKEEILSFPSPVEVKEELEIKVEPEIKEEETKVKEEEIKKEEECPIITENNTTMVKEEDTVDSPSPPPPMTTRKSAQNPKSDGEEKKDAPQKDNNNVDKKKLSREERKLEAIMKAFERMERQQQRKQEHQAKQAHRRESEPGPIVKEEEKSEPKAKRRRRKGRARTVSTNSQARRNRLNSADSSYATSGDECLLSPNESLGHGYVSSKDLPSCENSLGKEGGLLALANCESLTRNDTKSPIQDVDCNSNSANSSPETPLSSACLLVAAAVEPLEPSFKFPKTKKGLMNEWLNKSPECVQSASSISPSSLTPHIPPPMENNFYDTSSSNNFFTQNKNLTALAQAANYCDIPSQPHGNAKKRWLRQAISEDQCDSPSSRPESPPLSEMVAPPKKRKLPRESLSSDISPPTTPTNPNAPSNIMITEDLKRFQEQEDRVEIVTPGTDGDSPTQVVIDDATLKERVAEMQQEIGACFRLPEPRDSPQKGEATTATPSQLRCVLDPRLARPMFNNSEHLVATVEKNLSILGFEDQKADITPAKRKLSITEYRQRKQLTVNEKMVEEPASEENTLSQSPPQKLRPRSDSASSATSFMSSDDEIHVPELPEKAVSAFNSEPTELEKQRESVGLRLKKAFGLSIDDEARKSTAINMDTFLNCDLSPPVKPTAIQHYSPTFPIPGSADPPPLTTIPTPPPVTSITITTTTTCRPPEPSPMEETLAEAPEHEEEKVEFEEEEIVKSPANSVHDEEFQQPQTIVKPEMFYTPDEEDVDKLCRDEVNMEEVVEKSCDEFDPTESTNYVPPFNNPLYPNNSFTSFGSVIDDDAPYEGRNPSPPPELRSSTPTTYPTP